jgi:hypothetical protein
LTENLELVVPAETPENRGEAAECTCPIAAYCYNSPKYHPAFPIFISMIMSVQQQPAQPLPGSEVRFRLLLQAA